MRSYYINRMLAILLICSVSLLGYVMSVGAGSADEYDLVIDNIPVDFGDETLYVDTATNDRAFLISNDGLTIRSPYLTLYDLNNSYEHEDINYVIGDYCYTPEIPAQNATLNSITPIDRFRLSSWNGTVTVRCDDYDSGHLKLTVNSTDNATLLIQAHDLHRNYEYKVYIDGHPEGFVRVNTYQYLQYNYTGDWSTHTIEFYLGSAITEVPATYLNMINLFLVLGIFVVVAKSMIVPLKTPGIPQKVVTQTLIKAMIYIIVGCLMVTLVFRMFVGV